MMPDEWAERQANWEKAQNEFNNWPDVGKACDGSPIRWHHEWGDGVYENESGMVVSPIAFAARKSLRAQGIKPFGDL